MKAKKSAPARKVVRSRKTKTASRGATRTTRAARRPATARAAAKKPGAKRAKTTSRPAPKRKTPVRRRIARPRSGTVRPRRRKPASPSPSAPVEAAGLPPILFEGDRPGVPAAGAGERFALGAGPVEEQFPAVGDLPEAYGTQQVLVTPRDPHWLYVHWDLTRQQLRDYNAQSLHKHLVLRVSRTDPAQADAAPAPVGEVHVHPESRHWFVHVAEAGAKYAVELGFYRRPKGWTRIATSAPTATPPDVVSPDTNTRFATIPPDVALARLVDIVSAGAHQKLSLAHALEELRLAGHPELPPLAAGEAPRPWTLQQERALAEVIKLRQLGRLSVGSLDITELVQHGLQLDLSSLAALGWPAAVSSWSSPPGGAPAGPAGFWCNLNAELIIYGATEPSAHVTLGGQPVKLRPDGSFSYRFALPDGQYELPVTATSADGTEARHADLKFSRATECIGDVGQHPQDPALKPPTPANVV